MYLLISLLLGLIGLILAVWRRARLWKLAIASLGVGLVLSVGMIAYSNSVYCTLEGFKCLAVAVTAIFVFGGFGLLSIVLALVGSDKPRKLS